MSLPSSEGPGAAPPARLGRLFQTYCDSLRRVSQLLDAPSPARGGATLLVASPYRSALAAAVSTIESLSGDALVYGGIDLVVHEGYPSVDQIRNANGLILALTSTRYEPHLLPFVTWSRQRDLRDALAAVPAMALSLVSAEEIDAKAQPYNVRWLEPFARSVPLVPFALRASADPAVELPAPSAHRDVLAATFVAALTSAGVDLTQSARSVDRLLATLLEEFSRTPLPGPASSTEVGRAAARLNQRLRLRTLAAEAVEIVERTRTSAAALQAARDFTSHVVAAAQEIVNEFNHIRLLREQPVRPARPEGQRDDSPLAPLQDFRRRAVTLIDALLLALPESAHALREGFANARAAAMEQLSVVVVGVMSSGKSTLINTMLFLSGAPTDETLPVSEARTTAIPTFLERGPAQTTVHFHRSVDLEFFGPYNRDDTDNRQWTHNHPKSEHIQAYRAWLDEQLIDVTQGEAEWFREAGVERDHLPTSRDMYALSRKADELARREADPRGAYAGATPDELADLPAGVMSLHFTDAAVAPRSEPGEEVAAAADMSAALRAERISFKRPYDCLDGLCLIDTPGTHSDSAFHSAVTRRLLQRQQTGIVIYVVRDDEIDGNGVQQNIDELVAMRGRERLFVVINIMSTERAAMAPEFKHRMLRLTKRRWSFEPPLFVVNARGARRQPGLLDWQAFEASIRSHVMRHATGDLERAFVDSVSGHLRTMLEWAASEEEHAGDVSRTLEQSMDRRQRIDEVLASIRQLKASGRLFDGARARGAHNFTAIVDRAIEMIPTASWQWGAQRRDAFLQAIRDVIQPLEEIIPTIRYGAQQALDEFHAWMVTKAKKVPGPSIFIERPRISVDFAPFDYDAVYQATNYTSRRWFFFTSELAALADNVRQVIERQRTSAGEEVGAEFEGAFKAVEKAFLDARRQCLDDEAALTKAGGPGLLRDRAAEWRLFAERWLGEIRAFSVDA